MLPVFQSTPGLVTRRNDLIRNKGYDILGFNPLLVQLPGETLDYDSGDFEYITVSIHSWSSYQEKPIGAPRKVPCFAFQSTPGLVTRRNFLSQVRWPVTCEFQSTPGLVTRRNLSMVKGKFGTVCFNPLLVQLPGETFHRRMGPKTRQCFNPLLVQLPGETPVVRATFRYLEFQSTPGLVTRRNRRRRLLHRLYGGFNPLLVQLPGETF